MQYTKPTTAKIVQAFNCLYDISTSSVWLILIYQILSTWNVQWWYSWLITAQSWQIWWQSDISGIGRSGRHETFWYKTPAKDLATPMLVLSLENARFKGRLHK